MDEMRMNVFDKVSSTKKIDYNGKIQGIDYSKNPISEKSPRMRVFDMDMD